MPCDSSVASRFIYFAALVLSVAATQTASADHPFDARRYAFEIFSEDEITLSRYAETLDEATITAILESSWAELDSAADRAAGQPPESARAMIRDDVRGPGGVASRFEQKLREEAAARAPSEGAAGLLKQAARHPAVWGIAIAFAAALVWINRRRV